MGGARWSGLIYGDGGGARVPEEGAVFHGPYGTGAFQVIYAASARFGWWHWFAGVLWIAMAVMFLAVALKSVAVALLGAAVAFAFATARRQWRGSGLSSLKDATLLWLMCWLQPVVREWARVRGMLKSGARPTFKSALPDILPPIKPRKLSVKLAEYGFWSATGKGREEWLQAMRDLMAERKRVWREDDGWRWFDIEYAPLAWITVTEHHGGPKKLTRIRLLLRLDWRWLIGGILLAALCSFNMGALAGYVAVLSAFILRCRMKGHEWVQNAAERAGLQQM
jgi:O-antigen biosynthesis protein